MRVHQDAALAGFAVTEFAGFVAWIALWQTRRRGRAARGLVPAVTLLSIVALALMARAANLGGEIRHPEIRTDLPRGAAASAGDPERFVTSAISDVHGVQPVGLAGRRGGPLPRSLPVVRCAAGREPADTRGHEAGGVCGRASVAAVGHAGLRRQSHHRDAVLHRATEAVHRERAVLLEGRLPDDRRRELSLSDGVQEGLGCRRAGLQPG